MSLLGERLGLANRAGHYPRRALRWPAATGPPSPWALAMQPHVLLCDEPTSALDPDMVQEVLQVLGELVADGMTMVAVTHEVGFAREVAHRFAFMEHGAVVEEGPTKNLSPTAATEERTRAFLRKGRIKALTTVRPTVAVPGRFSASASALRRRGLGGGEHGLGGRHLECRRRTSGSAACR